MTSIKTIALIDDDPVFSFVTQMTIKQSGFKGRILHFMNGQEGIDFVIANIKTPDLLPELILLDLNMPKMDGWGFLTAFRELQKDIDKQMTIYVVSSSVDPSDLNRIKQIDLVNGFITKPLTKENIAADFILQSWSIPDAIHP